MNALSPESRSSAEATTTHAWVRRPWLFALLLAVLLATGLGLRLHHVDASPWEAYPLKQLRTMLTTRAVYVNHFVVDPPQWQREVASVGPRQLHQQEPPVLEWIVAPIWSALGHESLVAGRVVCAVAWLIGGVFLALILRRIGGFDAALIGTGLYALMPFGIVATRAFQPDSMMMAVMLAGVWATLRYDAQPSWTRLIVAAVISAAAVLIKPYCIFLLAGCFGMTQIGRLGIWPALRSMQAWAYAAVAFLPGMVYYQTRSITDHVVDNWVLPHLLLDPAFYKDTLNMMDRVVPLPLLVLAIAGWWMIPAARHRWAVVGLAMGYLAYCATFTRTIATHDYYHLYLLVVAGIPLGVLGSVAIAALRRAKPVPLTNTVMAVTACGVVVAAALLGIREVNDKTFETARPALIEAAREVGERVDDRTALVMSGKHVAHPLRYYGYVAGQFWPDLGHLPEHNRYGVGSAPSMPAGQRMAMFRETGEPRYFVAFGSVGLRQLEVQPDLAELLAEEATLIAEDPHYHIYRFHWAHDVSEEPVASRAAASD